MVDVAQQRREALGPAERIVAALIGFQDHMVHNRPGFVETSANQLGVQWTQATTFEQNGQTTVFKLYPKGHKGAPTQVPVAGREKPLVIRGTAVGTLAEDGTVRAQNRKVGEFRPAGLYPEVATWMYRQVADVWRLDNEFAAKWASYAYENDKSKDLRVVLAAFLMVQSRKGDPVIDQGAVAFYDDDYRDVGEAMALRIDKDKSLDAKLLLRVYKVLTLPAVAEINRELGFGRSARRPALGRWPTVVHKWLAYRESNPQLLEGLVKAGLKERVKDLARRSGYKPASPKFYEILRWKQGQAKDGRRTIAIGQAVKKAESWEGLTEEQICERIVSRKVSYKVLTGLLPANVGLTRAILAAAIEAGSLSDKDLLIATPTLEDHGLLQVQEVRERLEAAARRAVDQRASNIARNVKSKEAKELLQKASDVAVQTAVAEVIRGLRIYFLVDISGSMANVIEIAKRYIGKCLQAFPLDRTHSGVFNTVGREVVLKAASQAAVEQAFRGIQASGGTNYGAGVICLEKYKPKKDEDALIIFVGDEDAPPFTEFVVASGLRPVAFGLVKVGGAAHNQAVRQTAAALGIPCLMLDNETFEDPYALPQKLRALIAATPVGVVPQRVAPRVTLIDQILGTKLLEKPAWAA